MAQCGDVTAGPYSAAPYDITFEYTEESQVVVYYIVNRIEIIVPQNDPNYPWSFQHATRITFTSAVPPQPVYIRRSTDVTPLKAEFQTGNAIRAQDLNKNFQQIADACNENQADFKCLTNDLESVIQNIQTTIQYTAVSNVAALNTAAATNPDDQVGYDVLDSTGVDTLANPIISGLPATAGGGTGEDPVNGVYWNSGIITRVSWDRTAQNWDFISYYSRNGDNRYQQLTLASPITPNPDDYKDGTLWFDSGDANLYMLYNDGNSRQWVITNPLSAYGQIVTSSDVHWNRNAQTNTVYPKNSTDTIANNNGSASIDSTGAAVFTSVTSSGAISGTTITGSGAISGTTITGSGAISGTTITGSGAVSGDSIAATNAVTGASVAATGAVTGASVTATGNISSATLNTTGDAGIGEASPEDYGANYTTLETSGTYGGVFQSSSTDNSLKSYWYSDKNAGNARIGTNTNHPFLFTTNTVERMRIQSDGKIGIGRSDPEQLLHLSSTNTYIALSDSADSGAAGILFRRTDNDQNRGAITYDFSNDFMTFRSSSNGAGESMRLLSTGGLTFNGDTAQANALDDYEEGDWTPTLTDNNNNAVITSNYTTGRYVKIGNTVTVTFYSSTITVTNAGNSQAVIHNLPFTAKNRVGHYPVAVFTHTTCFTTDIQNGYMGTNSTNLFPIGRNGTLGANWTTTGSKYLMFSITYETN